MSIKSVIIGTAGHIDHGKTTLIKALTGVNTDRLEEEKRRGITIDLGFASLDLDGVHIGFIDVPGHEKFVKNMLAGAGGIDVFMLVVAADESVMPQTREHVDICAMLGIKSAIVAITKSDLADKDTLELVCLEVADLLENNGYEGTPIIPVSGVTGEGLDELKTELLNVAHQAVAKDESTLPRLPIDRIFTMKGFGTVVTGTLIAGTLKLGDQVELLPSGKKSVVKGLQVHGNSESLCFAGQRVAMNLPGIKRNDIARGELLTSAGSLKATHALDIYCRILPSAPGILENNQRIRFHLGSAELLGRVTLLDGKSIEPGSEGYARIKLEKPTVAIIGDRFVLRRYSPMITIGGGIVLDNLPQQIKSDKNALVQRLTEFQKADQEQRITLFIENSYSLITPKLLVERFGIQINKINSLLKDSIENGKSVLIAEFPLTICESAYFDSIKDELQTRLKEIHETLPLLEKVTLESLRQSLPKGTEDLLFKAALESLHKERIIILEGAYAAASDHVVNLTTDQQKVYDSMQTVFRKSGTSPPSPAQAIADQSHPDAKALFDLLLSRGVLIRIAEDFFCHQKTIEDIIDFIRKQSQDNRFTVAQFKEWFDISRKYAIPLLEYLDAAAITYREGDFRKISKNFN